MGNTSSPEFLGRVMFTEEGPVRKADLFNEKLQHVRTLDGVPQGCDLDSPLVLYFLLDLVPTGARIEQNSALGFIYDFIRRN